MTVEQLRNNMSVSEFYHWIAYKKLESKRIKEQQDHTRNGSLSEDMEFE